MLSTIFCVSGDRLWSDRQTVKAALQVVKQNRPNQPITMIHGGCRGLDTIAGEVATQLGFNVIIKPVTPDDWKKYGKGAGPVRNGHMLDLGPEFVLLFHTNIENSKGTKNMMNQCQKRGVPTTLITGK